MNKNRQILIMIMKENNLKINDISDITEISKTSLRDFLREETDEKYQALGSIGYFKLDKLFKMYNYKISYDDIHKLYGEGICDITGSNNGKQTKCYETWKGMFRRCYSEEWHEKEPTYIGCTVCEEWKLFSNFKKWYDSNYYMIEEDKNMQLDKDILHKGNKIYSPINCIFTPKIINSIFTKTDANRNNICIGVQYSQNKLYKYKAISSYYDFKKHKKQKIHLGDSNDKLEAFNLYKVFKEKYIKDVADLYKDRIPIELYNALYTYEVEITD
jgi:hypothetical protein